MIPIIRAVSVIGLALFAAVFLITFTAPERIEKTARGFITAQVRAKIDGKLDAAVTQAAAKHFNILRNQMSAEARRLRGFLRTGLAKDGQSKSIVR